ncbi:hypothetical protein bcere0028_1990 [Bacillus cereus AH1271]|nr:hypothetical protein bcere0028_1990 [Bacillus cereus AH1271]
MRLFIATTRKLYQLLLFSYTKRASPPQSMRKQLALSF